MTFSCHCIDAFSNFYSWRFNERSFFLSTFQFFLHGAVQLQQFFFEWDGNCGVLYQPFQGLMENILTQSIPNTSKKYLPKMRQKTKRLLRSVGRPALFSVGGKGTWSFEGRVDGQMTGRWTKHRELHSYLSPLFLIHCIRAPKDAKLEKPNNWCIRKPTWTMEKTSTKNIKKKEVLRKHRGKEAMSS